MFYNKSCASGLTPEDLEFIDKKYLHYQDFKYPYFKFKKTQYPIPLNIITSFKRAKYLKDKLVFIKKQKNLDFAFIKKLEILNNEEVLVDDKKISYKYLVGADGSTSTVRSFLKISNKNPFFALCYDVKNPDYHNFVCEYKEDFLGYFWIFPQNNFVNIGAGGLLKQISPQELKKQLEKYIDKMGLNLNNSRLTGALINYDYQGYRFKNVFLAGDAAGLASGLTGKGIYPAHLSAKQIAADIQGKKKNHLKKWIDKKTVQEKYLERINTKLKRKIYFNLGIKLIKNNKVKEKLAKIL